jgi:hypothetical protein
VNDERISAFEKWATIDLDGFVLEPPPLSTGRLLGVLVLLVGLTGMLAVGLLAEPENREMPAVLVPAAFALLFLYMTVTALWMAAVRTTLTVRGGTLRIERTVFGRARRTWEVPVGKVFVVPGKRRGRYSSWSIWLDLETPEGRFRIDLGSYGRERAEALLNGTLELLHLAKKANSRLPLSTEELDPEARRALEVLRRGAPDA